MARQFLTNIDLVKNQLLNGVIQNLASAPASPVAGLVYYDTTLNQFGVYYGGGTAAWVYLPAASVLTVAAGNSTITIGGTATNPTFAVNPANILLSSLGAPTGAVGFNGQQATNLLVENLASAPGSPVAGRVYYDTTLHQFGYYNGTIWVYAQVSVLSVAAGDTTVTIGGTATAPTVKVASGVMNHAYISDFDAEVKTIRLDQMAAPTAAVGLNGQQLTSVLAEKLASAPGTPVAGRFYYDTTLNEFGYYNGTTWIYSQACVLSVTAGDTTITVAGTATAPTIKVAPANISISSLAAATGTLNLNAQTLTGIANASGSTDAVNLQTLLTYVNGLTAKESVAYATTAPLPANAYSAGVLTATAVGALSVDSVAVVAGQRILVKNEVATANNGIYVVTTAGDGATHYVLTRSADANTAALLAAGIMVPVEAPYGLTAGTVNDAAVFLSLAQGPFVIGTSALTFAQVGTVTIYTAGTGLTLTGNSFALTVPVAITSGGTGAITAAAGLANLGGTSKYSTTVGDGAATTYTITHNLGTRAVIVQLHLTASTYDEVECDVKAATINTVTLTFATAPASGAYTVVVIG